MTNQEIPLISCVNMEVISRLFVRYKGHYGGLWTCRASNDQEWQWVMEDWLEELSRFSLTVLRAAFKKSMTEFITSPPTLPQLVQLCIKESGVPSVQEVVRLMVARDFSHPLVKMVYDKIGSWTLSNGKEEEIQRKAKEYYTSALSQFHVEPDNEWLKLENYNSKPKELAPPPKIHTNQEMKSFKQRLADYQQQIEDEKLQFKGETYREFDEKLIKPHTRDFYPKVYKEYCDYLLSIPENKTLILPVKYIYARSRLISQKEALEIVKNNSVGTDPQGNNKDQYRYSNGPNRLYKNFMAN